VRAGGEDYKQAICGGRKKKDSPLFLDDNRDNLMGEQMRAKTSQEKKTT
jgi:hypothetical protein